MSKLVNVLIINEERGSFAALKGSGLRPLESLAQCARGEILIPLLLEGVPEGRGSLKG